VKLDPRQGKNVGLHRFETTRWTVVLSCARTERAGADAEHALTELCRTYWRPVFALICRHGHPAADAQDLTQDFFLMLIKGNLLSLADPSRGRFRSLLRRALENFLTDRRHLSRRQKRGGAAQFLSWDEWMAEAPSQLSFATHDGPSWSPERVFDVRWAATVVEQALRRLSEECESRGRLRMFTVLNKYLSTERIDISYAVLAGALNVSEAMIKRLLHELRVRYRTILREEVARTVDNPADIEDEIRYLCAALASAE